MELKDLIARVKKIEGWLSEPEIKFLYTTAKRCSGKGVIVEIGSWQGKSTVCLGSGSKDGANVEIYAVDPHQDSYVHEYFVGKGISTFEKFSANIKDAGIADLVHPIVKKSEDAISGWNKPIEFLWIDGDHRYAEVKKDYDLWAPFVIEGGIIAFHDSIGSDVQDFVVGEVLKSRNIKRAGLVDSITSMTKSEHRTAFDAFRTSYIASVNRFENIMRKIPVPAAMRTGAKQFAKKVLNLLT